MRYYLTGFMGSGKTFLGKLWADDTGIQFYDLDHLIEEEERMSIDKIFALNGEDYFREKEAAILRNTDRFDDCIISCGGGTPCFFDNMNWMNRNGITVFLNESEETVFHHIVNDINVRPLLKKMDNDALKQYIRNKKNERRKFYDEAQIILSPKDLNRNGFSKILSLSK
jgi:shikimate kinase